MTVLGHGTGLHKGSSSFQLHIITLPSLLIGMLMIVNCHACSWKSRSSARGIEHAGYGQEQQGSEGGSPRKKSRRWFSNSDQPHGVPGVILDDGVDAARPPAAACPWNTRTSIARMAVQYNATACRAGIGLVPANRSLGSEGLAGARRYSIRDVQKEAFTHHSHGMASSTKDSESERCTNVACTLVAVTSASCTGVKIMHGLVRLMALIKHYGSLCPTSIAAGMIHHVVVPSPHLSILIHLPELLSRSLGRPKVGREEAACGSSASLAAMTCRSSPLHRHSAWQ